jgi:general secretion pathway protein B
MSFILDALKKSEIERQRQAAPGLVDSGMALRRPRFPLWAVALVVLLAVNLTVLVVVLTRSTTAPAPAARPASENASPAAAARKSVPAPADEAAVAAHFSPLDAPPVYAPEIPAGDAPGVATPGSSTVQAQTNRRTPAALGAPGAAARSVNSRAHADPQLIDDDPAPQELLPTINEITLSGPQALPELHLDVHVYATKPAERFVYINMRKYHEGAALAEGPTVERIRRDGVVLNFNGVRFLLPRQQ